jgi:3-phenylpropionate/trans-cinnamate dioxygenase ferredoxin subunit
VAEWVKVASLGELPPGSVLGLEIGDDAICLANADGAIYAIRDNCTHQDYPMHEGTIEGAEIECAWHGARFDLASGRATRLPALKPIRTFEVKVEGDDIFVAL